MTLGAPALTPAEISVKKGFGNPDTPMQATAPAPVTPTSPSPRPISRAVQWGLYAFIPVFGAALGLAVGYLVRGVDFGLSVAIPDAPALLFGVLAVLFLALAFHEIGHLIGGSLMGFKFMLLVIGPLKLVREGESIQWRLNEDLSLYGGLAASVPMDGHNLTPRFAVAIAAGPLASLFFSALGLGSAFLLRDVSNNLHGESLFWLMVFSLLNGGIFLATILPGKTGGFQTDGAQLLDCLRGGHDAERKQLSIAITGASAGGTRPREQNPRLMQRFLDLREGNSQDAIANWFGYVWLLDSGRAAEAGDLLDLALTQQDGLPETFRPALMVEAAFFEAWHRGNAAQARELLDGAQGGMVEAHTRARAEAAVLFAEERFAEAADSARSGLAVTRRSMDRGGAIAEHDTLQTIKLQAESRNPQPIFR